VSYNPHNALFIAVMTLAIPIKAQDTAGVAPGGSDTAEVAPGGSDTAGVAPGGSNTTGVCTPGIWTCGNDTISLLVCDGNNVRQLSNPCADSLRCVEGPAGVVHYE